MVLTATSGRLRLSHKRTRDANAVRIVAAVCFRSHARTHWKSSHRRLTYWAGQFCDR